MMPIRFLVFFGLVFAAYSALAADAEKSAAAPAAQQQATKEPVFEIQDALQGKNGRYQNCIAVRSISPFGIACQWTERVAGAGGSITFVKRDCGVTAPTNCGRQDVKEDKVCVLKDDCATKPAGNHPNCNPTIDKLQKTCLQLRQEVDACMAGFIRDCAAAGTRLGKDCQPSYTKACNTSAGLNFGTLDKQCVEECDLL